MTKKEEQIHKKLNKPFHISSICRLDLVNDERTEKQVLRMSDYEMDYLARKMGDVMQECYWDALEVVLDDILSKKPK